MIDLNLLPKHILNKIPLSLRVNCKNNSIDESKIPLNIVYDIKEYLNSSKINENKEEKEYSNVLDLNPKIDISNDFTRITDPRELILEYLINLINTQIGSYPFDPTYGSNVKSLLGLTDRNEKDVLLGNEMGKIVTKLKKVFGKDIKIVNNTFGKASDDSVGTIMYMTFKVIIDSDFIRDVKVLNI